MGINIEKAIEHMQSLKARNVKYSMTGSRTGTDGTADCSGAIYAALRLAGATDAGWVLNTDSMHSWLVKNGYELIGDNKEWSMKRGDIVILGKKGASGGAAGHVFMAMDNINAIHCNWGANGVSIDNENTMPYGQMGWYAYRLKGGSTSSLKPESTIVNEVIAGKWGIDPERSKKLKAAGYNPTSIQNGVNLKLSNKPPLKPLDTIAKEVIAGKWGNDPKRSTALKNAGYDPKKVQAQVNKLA